jgi:hypothetical protein
MKAHRASQCERCYESFSNRDDLEKHHRMVGSCIWRLDGLREGIGDSQWEKICNVLRVRRGKEKSKEPSDYKKWFEVLDIIYPNVPKPPNLTPCKSSIPSW